MALPFHLETGTIDGRRVLTVAGELDSTVAGLFEEALCAAVAGTPHGEVLVVDMERVVFFGSSASRALVRGAVAAEDAGVGMLVSVSRVVRVILGIVGVNAAVLPALSLVEGAHAADERRDVAPRIRREWRVSQTTAARPTRRPGGPAGTSPSGSRSASPGWP